MGAKQTTFSRLLFALAIGLLASFLACLPVQKAGAAAGINSQLSFEGKIVNSSGQNISDGTYNMQFKIYQDGNGCIPTSGCNTDPSTQNGGTLKWTENRLIGGSGGVALSSGTFQINLGSVTSFGNSVDWNQDTLWLSLQIGNTSSCTITTTFQSNCGGDGEMISFIRLTAVPYANNSAALSGLVAGNFVQLAQGLQADTSTTNASIAINKNNASGTPNILQLQKASSNVLVLDNSGYLTQTPVNLTAGKSALAQTFTNADASGGTANGLSQTVTVSPTSSAATTNGINTSLTDSTTLANNNNGITVSVTDNGASGSKTNKGLVATAGGSNTSQSQYAVDAAANHGLAIRGASTGTGGNVTCGPTTAALSLGVCGSTTQASSAGYGGYFAATGNGGTALFATNGTSTSNLLQLQDGSNTKNVVSVADEGAATFQNSTDSSTAFQILRSNGSPLFNVDTTSSNLVTNGSIEVSPLANWTYSGTAGSVARDTSGTTPYQGNATLAVVTNNGGATNGLADAAKQTLATTLSPSTTYYISWYDRITSSTFTDVIAAFSYDGATSHVATCTSINTQTVVTGGWTKHSCQFITGSSGTAPTSSNAIFIGQASAAARTFYIDAVQLQTTGFSAFQNGQITLNGVINSPIALKNQADSTTAFQVQSAGGSNLLTVDSLNNSIALGVGTITASGAITMQGGGAFILDTATSSTIRLGDSTNNITLAATTREPTLNGSARHTKRIALAAEYAGASMTADGSSNIGTMTSDNMTASAFRNFYKWTTTQGTAQDYDIWVRIPVPTDYAALPSGQTICVDTYSSATTANSIALTLYGTDNSSVTLTDGDLTPSATGTWQTQCTSSITGGTYAANGYITLDFKLTAPATSGDVRISDLYLDYLSKW
jgi:hypothetical protein